MIVNGKQTISYKYGFEKGFFIMQNQNSLSSFVLKINVRTAFEKL